MIQKINVIPQRIELQKVLKVAAYARVSVSKDSMLQSLSAQISYYSNLIQNHKGWVYAGVYSDEGISGTKDDRLGFNLMINDAKNGKIDLIITKSISRFARNTLMLLNVIRDLKSYNVNVYFEEQNIYSLSSDGELMLTILASYAQEEARSASENMRWRIKKNFEQGLPWGAKAYGYIFKDIRYEIVPEEAEVVKRIFKLFLSDKGFNSILRILNKEGYKTRSGYKWTESSIRTILTNYDYTGNLMLQKTYRKSFLCKKKKINKGEYTKYHVANTHDAIVSLEDFNKVQEELRNRAEKVKPTRTLDKNPFKGILICGSCGKILLRRNTNFRTIFLCSNFVKNTKEACDAKQISYQELIRVTNEMLGVSEFNEALLKNYIKEIKVFNNNTINFIFHSGKEQLLTWNTLSRKDSWTDEMKEQARRRVSKNA